MYQQIRQRKCPIGAYVGARGVLFRVWAPKVAHLAVEVDGTSHALAPEGDGYFSGTIADAKAGARYGFHVEDRILPDPASRWQPDGPHGLSSVVDPSAFQWTDHEWRGVTLKGQVLYELHIGTFTPEGTWRAAAERLPLLKDVGVTLVEMMPVAEFPGRFGWGYDGVGLFAPAHIYGEPDDLRRFVDHAHALGIGVILDVVYNHFGPDGNYLPCFSDTYLTRRYDNDWGDAINFDGPGSGPVREFFCANAAYWIDEFHFDGLRLDATQQMFDASPEHVLAAIGRSARQAAGTRSIILVAENEPQEARLVRPERDGGLGLDAIWNDDFHHSARVRLTGRRGSYLSDFSGSARELTSAVKHGFLFQGQWFAWHKKRRGSPSLGLDPERLVCFLENHDQVSNSGFGARLVDLTDRARLRALTALLLLAPATPMLFQGQEFAATAPFVFFADHKADLGKAVAAGRRQFLLQFERLTEVDLPDPGSPESVASCVIDWSQRARNAWALALHRDLIELRRTDPVFRLQGSGGTEVSVLSDDAFLLRSFGECSDRLLIVNLGSDLEPPSISEPLLAPPAGQTWRPLWSSEDPRYGGEGTGRAEAEGRWRIPGHAAIVMASGS